MKKLLSIFLFLPSLAMAICNPFVPGALTADMLNQALSVGCITSGTINNAVIGYITPVAGYFTTLSSTTGISGPVAATSLSASSSVSGVGFSNYWANPPILGGSAPNVVNGSVFNGAGTGLTGTASALSVGSAVSATNVAGGTAGAIPYQSGVGATGFISPGTATYILTSNGSGVAPSFQSAGSAYNPASVAITGGTINGTAIGGTTASSGAFTSLVSTNPKFSAQDNALVQGVTSGVITTVAFPVTNFDTASAFSGSTTFTAPITGYYQFNWAILVMASSSSLTNASTILHVAGASDIYGSGYGGPAVATLNLTGAALVHLTAGAACTIEVILTGTTPAIVQGGSTTYFTGELVP